MEHKKLTPEQELFCREYLKDFNGKQAAIRAGYSEKSAASTASEILTYPNVQKRLHDLMQKVFTKVEDEIKEVVDELKLIAFSDIKDVVDWSTESKKLLDEETGKHYNSYRTIIRAPQELGKKSRAVAEISESESSMSSSRKVKMYDKLRALELLGKYHKMFTEKIDLSNSDGTLKPEVKVYLPKNGRDD